MHSDDEPNLVCLTPGTHACMAVAHLPFDQLIRFSSLRSTRMTSLHLSTFWSNAQRSAN